MHTLGKSNGWQIIKKGGGQETQKQLWKKFGKLGSIDI